MGGWNYSLCKIRFLNLLELFPCSQSPQIQLDSLKVISTARILDADSGSERSKEDNPPTSNSKLPVPPKAPT